MSVNQNIGKEEQLAGKNEENLKSTLVSEADEDEGKRAWARAFLHAAVLQRDRMRAKRAAAEKPE